MPNLWTAELQYAFHSTVEKLHKRVEKNPLAEVDYRTQNRQYEKRNDNSQYTLSLMHELQLADHLAFLAHTEEGVKAISAVCVEEKGDGLDEGDDGLLVILASNETPSDETVSGLQTLLNVLSSEKKGKEEHLQELFNCVLSMSQHRILQRLRPAWVPMPSYFKGSQRGLPLWERLESAIKGRKASRSLGLLIQIRNLIADMKKLKVKPPDEDRDTLLGSLIRKCAEVSYAEGHRSLERRLQSVHQLASITERYKRDILQVDKLARYWGLCRDLSKISREPSYQRLIRNIRLKPLRVSYPRIRPPGATKGCNVHAEVQIILHYESDDRNPLLRSPRAIGCSKSACFLCDLLIRKTGMYKISHSHRRLYTQWRIPDVNWMKPDRIKFFRRTIQSMTADMKQLKPSIGWRLPVESTAALPLSMTTTPSEISRESRLTITPRIVTHGTGMVLGTEGGSKPTAPPHCTSRDSTPRQSLVLSPAQTISSEHLSLDHLPLIKNICLQTPGLHLTLGNLHVHFEFIGLTIGRLGVKRANEVSETGETTRLINALDIPTDGEMALGRPENAPSLKFRLQYVGIDVEVEITWGMYPGWKTEQKRAV